MSRRTDEMTFGALEQARRRPCSVAVVKEDGTSAIVDRRDASKFVLRAMKDRIRDDVHTLFDNYMLLVGPQLLAEFLKDSGFTKPDGDVFLPHELVATWKKFVGENVQVEAREKQNVHLHLEAAFKDYLRHYVEEIVTNLG